MFTVTFPYDIGTFVKIKSQFIDSDYFKIGTIECYQCVTDDIEDFIVMVSGYKEPWCGEYLLKDLIQLTDKEIEEIKSKYEKESKNV